MNKEIQEQNTYIAVTESNQLAKMVKDNLGDSGIKLTDLPRIKMPTGGSVSWGVETDKGIKSLDSLNGVIVAHKEIRAYWPKSGVLNVPPDCKSDDTVRGFGNPGGACYTCPMAQYGTKKNQAGEFTKGQACKTMHVIYLLQKNDLLPTVIQFPPTSLHSVHAYLIQLTMHMLMYWQVETQLKLTQVKGGAQTYSVVEFEKERNLNETETAAMSKYAQMFQELIESQGVTLQETESTTDNNLEHIDFPVEGQESGPEDM